MRNWGHQKTFLCEVLLSTDLEKQKRNKQRIEKGARPVKFIIGDPQMVYDKF